MGFAWLPEHAINESLAAGRLRRVALQHQRQREVPLYIGYPQALRHSPDVQLLVQVLGELCQRCNSRCAP